MMKIINVIPSNVRPKTNKDYTNDTFIGFRLPHPMKHYRKGFSDNINKNNCVVTECIKTPFCCKMPTKMADTNIDKDYYQTNYARLYNRCQTFTQRQFNYGENGDYVAQCTSTKGCAKVAYKPNNEKFAQQGAVSQSNRLLRLKVDTINTNRSANANAFIIKNKGPTQCVDKYCRNL